MNGHQTCHQNIKCLYAEAGNLREIVLRRLAAVGCKIKEKSLAKAETIVNGRIAELIVNPEYAILLDRRGGESQLLSLLVRACAAELHSAIPPAVGHSSLSQQAQETDTAKQRICRPAAATTDLAVLRLGPEGAPRRSHVFPGGAAFRARRSHGSIGTEPLRLCFGNLVSPPRPSDPFINYLASIIRIG